MAGVMVGCAGLTYATLARLVNHTTLIAGPQGLQLRHDPLPWSSGLQIPRDRLQRVRVFWRAVGEDSTAYQLAAVGVDGTRSKLLEIPFPEELLRLAAALNERLGVPDAPAPAGLPARQHQATS